MQERSNVRSMIGAICGFVLVLAGCGGNTPTAPNAPAAPTTAALPSPTRNEALTNWYATATVLSKTGNAGCGWGTTPGETRTDVGWQVKISGDSVALDEDMSNWPTDHIPYTGVMTGQAFTARYSQGEDYLRWVCQFKGGELSGRFSSDFRSFEAFERLVWGPPEAETVVERRWTGTVLGTSSTYGAGQRQP